MKTKKHNKKVYELKCNKKLICGCGKSTVWLSKVLGYCNYCFKNLEK